MSFEIISTSNFEKELKILAKKYSKIKEDIKHLKRIWKKIHIKAPPYLKIVTKSE